VPSPHLYRTALLLLAAATFACGRSTAADEERRWYRAIVSIGDAEDVPFFLEIPDNCNNEQAAIANGAERIPVTCRRVGTHLLLDFPVYGARIAAETGGDGGLAGFWEHDTMVSRTRTPFRATPAPAPDEHARFEGVPAEPSRRVTGPWRMTLEVHGPAKGLFEQEPSGVTRGTIDVPADYGDLRFLAGEVTGAAISLSTFDGGSASLLRGRIGDDGRMQGELLNSYGVRERFTGEPSADFEVGDPLQQVTVTSAERRIDFPPLLTDRYAGKAAIIEVFGTWCANCNDLAPLLTELYRTYRDDGLEMLGVAYEYAHMAADSSARLEAYRAKYRVEWDVLPADEDLSTLLGGPATLSPIGGVPVTIFVNRDRTIRAIYTGFRGPAMGAAHQRTVETFRRLAREIVASAPPRP
jgi:thiol-disulfide isomerase/thioredoxin